MVTEKATLVKGVEIVYDAIAREISDIVEEAKGGPEPDVPETGQLFYRMPLQGVRYYSFSKRDLWRGRS